MPNLTQAELQAIEDLQSLVDKNFLDSLFQKQEDPQLEESK